MAICCVYLSYYWIAGRLVDYIGWLLSISALGIYVNLMRSNCSRSLSSFLIVVGLAHHHQRESTWTHQGTTILDLYLLPYRCSEADPFDGPIPSLCSLWTIWDSWHNGFYLKFVATLPIRQDKFCIHVREIWRAKKITSRESGSRVRKEIKSILS